MLGGMTAQRPDLNQIFQALSDLPDPRPFQGT